MPEEKLDVREQEDNNHEEGKEETIPNSEEGIPFFPNHLLKEVIAIFIILGILFTLAIFLPFKLHEKADPLITPEGIKPEWYFLWVYQALKYFPPKMLFLTGKAVGVILMFVALVFLQFVWPILDNSPERHPRRRRFSLILVGGFFGFAIILTALSIVSEKTVTIGGAQYHFDLKGIPHKVETEDLKIVPEADIIGAEAGTQRIAHETDSTGGEENKQRATPEVDSADTGGKSGQQVSSDTGSVGTEEGGQP
ncbi:TPA: hypothetical protein EYP66_03570 [Candidatus Poribacteria bacterium]|nr:hypothetical protein [Candidatus Poribacteria bacterium]